jgi:hypothetical protein
VLVAGVFVFAFFFPRFFACVLGSACGLGVPGGFGGCLFGGFSCGGFFGGALGFFGCAYFAFAFCCVVVGEFVGVFFVGVGDGGGVVAGGV